MEEEIATHSSILAGIIPWTDEPGGLPWGHKESETTEQLCMYVCTIYFIHDSVYLSIYLSINTTFFIIPTPSYPAVFTSLFSTSVSPLLPCK